MAKKIDFTYRVFDNCLEIIPKEEILDNSIYDLRIKNIKSLDGKVLEDYSAKITTKLTPCYCLIDAVKILLNDFEIPDSEILFFIRQASKQAEYINGGPPKLDENGNVPYVIEKYVETKATYDALVKAYISGNNDAGMEGSVGDLTFKNGDTIDNLRKLLTSLKDDIKTWQEAIRGYEFEGRNEMNYALRANFTLRGTPAHVILKDYTRNVNLGKDRI